MGRRPVREVRGLVPEHAAVQEDKGRGSVCRHPSARVEARHHVVAAESDTLQRGAVPLDRHYRRSKEDDDRHDYDDAYSYLCIPFHHCTPKEPLNVLPVLFGGCTRTGSLSFDGIRRLLDTRLTLWRTHNLCIIHSPDKPFMVHPWTKSIVEPEALRQHQSARGADQ